MLLLYFWFLITVGNISEVKTYTMEKPPLDPDFPIRERKTFRQDNVTLSCDDQTALPEVLEETGLLSPGGGHK